ncbi:TetR family transcriptional regulator [Kribbella sp. VKM Ac-2571]|uniref:TetR/AcrR family transcriptional regulator n=1 Tax=Kribbella sp. VKM Ac-2571 TaxID=2512222 RepID=UPI00105EC01C|nr:TetR/AcrR family transcriptional regulator [Kribbella sp. VKM Ac-2571]TDO56634.1 TetR family transcriptional regulator [Kribbella sp. VKM Ac-2571]
MSISTSATESGRERLLRLAIEYFAANGIGDASLRQIASKIGSSHRMLIYYFDSRDGLLEAVVGELERAERDTLTEMLNRHDRPGRELAWEFWSHIADIADFYAPLYFELASRAMRGEDPSAALRIPNVEMWVEALARMWSGAHLKPAQAKVHARLNLGVARGLLHDLLLTRDRKAVDQAMAMWDWLCFREPSPVRQIARMSASWTAPRPSE